MVFYVVMALPLIFLAAFTYCFLFCDKCEERDKQMEADARQMKVARELAQLARKERQEREAKESYLVAIRDLRGQGGTKQQ